MLIRAARRPNFSGIYKGRSAPANQIAVNLGPRYLPAIMRLSAILKNLPKGIGWGVGWEGGEGFSTGAQKRGGKGGGHLSY